MNPTVNIDENSGLNATQINASIPTIITTGTDIKQLRRSPRLAVVQYLLNKSSLFVVNGLSIIQDNNPTLSQALKSAHRRDWIIAIFTELENLENHKTWRNITSRELQGTRGIPSKILLRTKRSMLRKARIVILGNKDFSILGNVFAPTAHQSSVLLLLAVVVFYRLKVKGYDVYGAFLIPEQKRRVVIKLPKETTPGYFASDFSISDPEYHRFRKYLTVSKENETDEGLRLLLKTMYGQADSPKEFYEHVNNLLTSNGYNRSTFDPCIFFRRPSDEEFIMIVVHVDDFLVAATHEDLIDHVEVTFRKEYQITISNNVESYLGMNIIYNSDLSITVSNPLIINELVEKANLKDASIAKTPMRSDFNDAFQDDSIKLTTSLKLMFQEILGSLIFIVKTRPDIAYAVNRLATRTTQATEKISLPLIAWFVILKVRFS